VRIKDDTVAGGSLAFVEWLGVNHVSVVSELPDVVSDCCSLASDVLSDAFIADEGSPDAVAVATEGNEHAQGLWRYAWIFDRPDWNDCKGS
jgi:hypothetical protein